MNLFRSRSDAQRRRNRLWKPSKDLQAINEFPLYNQIEFPEPEAPGRSLTRYGDSRPEIYEFPAPDRTLVRHDEYSRPEVRRRPVPHNSNHRYSSYEPQRQQKTLTHRTSVPADLAESTRLLKLSNPDFDPQAPRPATRKQQPRAIEAGPDRRSERHELEQRRTPKAPQAISVPADLQESWRNLQQARQKNGSPASNSSNEHVTLASELEGAPVPDSKKGQADFLALVDSFADNGVPHRRIALAGFAGTGKSYTLRDFLSHLHRRSPHLQVLKMDASDRLAAKLTYVHLGDQHAYGSLSDILTMLESMVVPGSGNWLILFDGLNDFRSCTAVRDWSRRVAMFSFCVIATTRRLDLARVFVDDSASIFSLSTMSPWFAKYELERLTKVSNGMDQVAEALTHLPVAIVSAGQLLQNLNMPPDEFVRSIYRLLGSTTFEEDASVRQAYQYAHRFFSTKVYPTTNNTPNAGQVTSLFVILTNIVQPCWLTTLDRLEKLLETAMTALAVLALLGRTIISIHLLGLVEDAVGCGEAVACLKNHCILTMTGSLDSEKAYSCHSALYLAVKVWLVGHEEKLEEARGLADVISGRSVSMPDCAELPVTIH